jgi:hypothetical protein
MLSYDHGRSFCGEGRHYAHAALDIGTHSDLYDAVARVCRFNESNIDRVEGVQGADK